MTNRLNLTWRDVLDSYAPARVWGGPIDNYVKLVDSVGYNFFNWNGNVYRLIRLNGNKLGWEDTEISVEELT